MPTLTTAQRRAHYDDFVAEVIELCSLNGVRADLASGRGRPVEECERMQKYLSARTARFGARRAHYTVASLIAMQRHLAHEDGPYTPESAHPAPDGPADDPLLPDIENASQRQEPLRAPAPGATAADDPAPGQKTPGPHWRARPNLGTTLALAVGRHGFKQPRMDDRVKTLTRLSTPLLHPRLWTLAAHLSSRHAARLDFAVLLEDLAWWDDDRLHTAARWRDSYFQTLDRLASQED
ncbi:MULTISPECIES: type I-E CRISPR-associated protein Cse2/CasB [unclassified Streptomyces]|uniref:type I-E CRISPR-associated protein Cse2/CasB n=1 Tax=unclassified Streptomyces TaxID=2593676 RepID=UPI002E809004|nr:type I-E CRISPR-associated protein Cse2/CasB [Streptomyces sp. NBC_00589]WTI33543.1 type I-E CRISPR-associated protein Cse2/CasB [Streptomyces sp. NBC_00775]WTI42384.1 type I-E CRISPR-associated protein Cse2/CasB [Streptomyces sp. NBC_00775]WUB23934.1 type I-E CRISPR-associated protein Cse2/CasB [Streptomyces sp. NBC_00589]WUB32785.1 type I-E CRISPR-associated protein Cse2/CasB [Streptomyces sp. NBC_00589]